MNNWNDPKEVTPTNNQRILICREDFFIIIGKYVNGLYHDTRYKTEESISVLRGEFYWMKLPSVSELKEKSKKS